MAVILTKLNLIAFIKIVKNKRSRYDFVLLSRLRNITGRFIKTCFHKPIKIVNFLHTGDF